MKNKVWKYDNQGNERSLDEQLVRRENDLKIAKAHVDWYNKHPLSSNEIKNNITKKHHLEHLNEVLNDIKKINVKIK